MAIELSYCVVNTARRQLLHYCLDAIARERATVAFETEVLVLDNGSTDGSADAARTHPATSEVIALDAPRPLGANAAELLRVPEIGTVEEGKRADLALWPGDPIEEIDSVLKPVLVMQSGTAIEP